VYRSATADEPEKFIPLFVTNLLEDKKVPVYGDGMQMRDWLYVDDHCEAIDLVMRKGKIGGTYCIGGNSEKNARVRCRFKSRSCVKNIAPAAAASPNAP